MKEHIGIVDHRSGTAAKGRAGLAVDDAPRRSRWFRLPSTPSGRLPPALVIADLVMLLAVDPRSGPWVLVVALFAVLAASGGFYRSRLTPLFLDDAPGLVVRLLGSAAAVETVIDGSSPDVVVGGWGRVAVAVGALLFVRAATYAGVRMVRVRRWVDYPTLIVGSGKVGRSLAEILIEHPEYGLRPIGFHDPDPIPTDIPWLPVPMVGDGDPLDRSIEDAGARVVILAFSSMPEEELVRAVRACSRIQAEIFYVPRLFDLHSLKAQDVDDVWGLPLVRLRRAPLRSVMWRVKRVVDVTFAVVALLLVSPLLALIALGVRLTMGRPVLFRQQRLGTDHQEFTIYKFRSFPNADVTVTDSDWDGSERRPSRLGAVLRATSLDELPQLWNILRGDMSLVGPRPEREHFVRQFAEDFDFYGDRHRVPTGLTGLAQIHGLRGDTSIEDRARFDNAYVERWSLLGDLKILLRTPLAAWRWRGR